MTVFHVCECFILVLVLLISILFLICSVKILIIFNCTVVTREEAEDVVDVGTTFRWICLVLEQVASLESEIFCYLLLLNQKLLNATSTHIGISIAHDQVKNSVALD